MIQCDMLTFRLYLVDLITIIQSMYEIQMSNYYAANASTLGGYIIKALVNARIYYNFKIKMKHY